MSTTEIVAAIAAAVAPAVAVGTAVIVAYAGVWVFKLIRRVI